MKNVIKKLFTLQQQFNSKKDSYNQFGKYAYRNAEKMLDDLKPLLNSLNLVIVFEETMLETENWIKSTIHLIDIDTCEEFTTECVCKVDNDVKGMQAPQTVGAAISYLRKYLLQGLLAVSEGNIDPDCTNTHGNVQIPSEAPKTIDRTDYSNMTKEQKILNIKIQINDCSTIDELSALFKKIGKWSENAEIRNFFTKRKNEIIQGQDPAF